MHCCPEITAVASTLYANNVGASTDTYFFFAIPAPGAWSSDLAKQRQVGVTSHFEIFCFAKCIYSVSSQNVLLDRKHCVTLLKIMGQYFIILFHFPTSSNPNSSLFALLVFLTENYRCFSHRRRRLACSGEH